MVCCERKLLSEALTLINAPALSIVQKVPSFWACPGQSPTQFVPSRRCFLALLHAKAWPRCERGPFIDLTELQGVVFQVTQGATGVMEQSLENTPVSPSAWAKTGGVGAPVLQRELCTPCPGPVHHRCQEWTNKVHMCPVPSNKLLCPPHLTPHSAV
jgi:hypothetical protein